MRNLLKILRQIVDDPENCDISDIEAAEVFMIVLPKLLAVVEAAKKYKEVPMSDDDNRRLAFALKALEDDV